MWEFEIENKINGKTKFILGNSFEKAMESYYLNPEEWRYIDRDYID